MPSNIYFIDYPEDFSEPCTEFKKGEQLLSFITNDATLKIETDQNRRTVHFLSMDGWRQLFDLDMDNDIYLNYRVVVDCPELYYKLVELAEKLRTCLEVDGVLVFVPEYGLLHDPEEEEKNLPFELYGYELGEKMIQRPSMSVREAIIEIVDDKQRKDQQLKKLEAIKRKVQLQSEKSRKRIRMILFVIIFAAMIYFVFLN